MNIEMGQAAPRFSLLSDSGGMVSIDDFPGRNILLYFYPKDDTPGCTEEAKDLKDNIEVLTELNTVVIGVSRDNVKSHNNFKTRYNLPFVLLCDENVNIISEYGCWVEKTMFGKKYMGIMRSTFFIDENRIVKNIWRNVKVKGHVLNVLEYIRSIKIRPVK